MFTIDDFSRANDIRRVADSMAEICHSSMVADTRAIERAMHSLYVDFVRETMSAILYMMGFSEVPDHTIRDAWRRDHADVFREDAYADDFWCYSYDSAHYPHDKHVRTLVRVEDRDAAFALVDTLYGAGAIDMFDDGFSHDYGWFTVYYVDGNGRVVAFTESLYYAMEDAHATN